MKGSKQWEWYFLRYVPAEHFYKNRKKNILLKKQTKIKKQKKLKN